MNDLPTKEQCRIQFSLILDERITKKRQIVDDELAKYSFFLLSLYAMAGESEQLLEQLNLQIDTLLKDCEIFYRMPESKAMDALQELSNLASLYVKMNDGDIYTRICLLINTIRSSYLTTFT